MLDYYDDQTGGVSIESEITTAGETYLKLCDYLVGGQMMTIWGQMLAQLRDVVPMVVLRKKL